MEHDRHIGDLVDVSDIFYFFCLGKGQGEPKGPGGGAGTISHGRSQEVGGLPGGWGRGPGGCLGEFLGGGAKYFFSGPKFPPRRSWCHSWKNRLVQQSLGCSSSTWR